MGGGIGTIVVAIAIALIFPIDNLDRCMNTGNSNFVGLWQNSDFNKLWLGQTISLLGSAVTRFALPIIAVLTLQATPIQMGILGAVQFAPFILVGLLAGVWVDRLPRRPILIGTALGCALLLSLIPLIAILGQLRMEYLYIIAFCAGCLNVFFETAYFAFLPSLVRRQQLVGGNSKLQFSWSFAQLIGPGLASLLVQWFTASLAVALDVVSFLLSALLIRSIRTPELVQAPDRSNFWQEMAEGLQAVWGNPLLRAFAACASTCRLFISLIDSIYVLYLTRELGLSPLMLGLIQMLGASGALVGALFAQPIAQYLKLGPAFMSSAFLWGMGYVLVPLAHDRAIVAISLLVGAGLLSGVGATVFDINQVSLRQTLVPDRMQGRMNASIRFLIWSPIPIGALLGGWLGEVVGLRTTLWTGALGATLAVLWLLFSPVRDLREG